MNFKFLQSAFDKLGGQTDILTEIKDNTALTASAVNPGGELFDRMDRMVTAMENIESSAAGGKGGLQQAIILKLVAPTLKPIGLGLGFIIDALEKAGPGKELAEKMDALTKGLVVLGDIGLSILKFAGYIILATPLLLIAGAASIIWIPALMLMIKGVSYAAEGLDEKKMKNIALLGDVGKSILVLAGSLALVALLAIPAMIGLLATTLILVGIAGVFKIIDMIGADPKKMEDFGDALKSLGIGLLLLSGTLALISIVAAPVLTGLLVAMAVIGGIGLTFWLLDTLGADKSMRKGALALMLVGLSIVVLGGSLALFNILVPDFEVALKSVALIGGVALAYALAGVFASQIVKGALSMVLAGISLVVVGFGLKLMSDAIPKKGGWEFIGQVAAVVGGLAVAMAAAGLAAPFIAPGAAVMILAGGALIAIGAGLKSIASVDFKSLGTIDEKGSKPFNFSGQVSEGFLGFGAGRRKSNFEVAVESIAAGLALGPLSIAGILAGAPTLILASGALLGISKGLKSFKEVAKDADLPGLKGNMNLIVSGLADTFAEVGTKYPGGGGGLMSSLFGSGSDTSVVAQGISAVSGMGRALKGIAKGVQAMAELKFPTGYDKDGNPTGYETINLTSAVPALIANTQLIVSGLSKTFAEVGESDAAQGSTWFTSSSYEKGIEVVKKMGTPLYNLANGVQNMANLKFPTGYDKDGNPTGFKTIGDIGGLVKKLSANTKAIIIGLAGVFDEVGKSGAGESGGWFSKSNFEKGIEVAMSLGEPYTELSDVVNTVVDITGKIGGMGEGIKAKVTAMIETISHIGTFWGDQFNNGVSVAMRIGAPYAALSGATADVTNITSSISDATDLREKVTAMIESITNAGGDVGADILQAKTNLIYAIGRTYSNLGVAIPAIVTSVNSFIVDKGKAFAAIFGGESPAELFESKTNFLKGLTTSYLKMAVTIPLIVGSINTVQAEQLDAFTSIYGGSMHTDAETLKARETLFIAAGNSYEKIGRGSGQISSAIAGVSVEQLESFKGLFMGRVSMLRPIAGYNAQSELWNAIGGNMTATSTAFPTISSAINAMDISKLTETRQMFEALAVLAEGGESPEDILGAMGESLETAMQRLADILMEFQTSVGDAQAGQEGILTQIASMPGDFVGSLREGFSGGGGGADMGQVTSAIKQLHKQIAKHGIKIQSDRLSGR